MISKTEQLVNKLVATIEYLKLKNDIESAKKLEYIVTKLNNATEQEVIKDALDTFRGYFGGMGSFNDLYFEDDNEVFAKLKNEE